MSEIGDTTNLTVNINWFKKKYTKANLKDKDYKWAYSKSKGYYIGMKLVFAMEYHSLKPLAFLVFPGGPSDSRIFDEIVTELMRRKILKKGDSLVLDKGFYAYRHYIEGLTEYGIVPLIFPRINFKLEKVLNHVQLHLEFFDDKLSRVKEEILHLETILAEFKRHILNWRQPKPKRSLIEAVFKVIKGTFSLGELHSFTLASVTKIASLGVVLAISISLGFGDRKSAKACRVVMFWWGLSPACVKYKSYESGTIIGTSPMIHPPGMAQNYIHGASLMPDSPRRC